MHFFFSPFRQQAAEGGVLQPAPFFRLWLSSASKRFRSMAVLPLVIGRFETLSLGRQPEQVTPFLGTDVLWEDIQRPAASVPGDWR